MYAVAPVFHTAEGGVRGLLHMQQQRIPPSCRQIPVQSTSFLHAELVALQICAYVSRLGDVHLDIACAADSAWQLQASRLLAMQANPSGWSGVVPSQRVHNGARDPDCLI